MESRGQTSQVQAKSEASKIEISIQGTGQNSSIGDSRFERISKRLNHLQVSVCARSESKEPACQESQSRECSYAMGEIQIEAMLR